MQTLPDQFTKVTRLFSSCLAKRIIPSDVVVKVMVTAISSWWYARMYRRSAEKDATSKPPSHIRSDSALTLHQRRLSESSLQHLSRRH